ncbi:MAG TPA: cation diffusion facilitator family transporter [Balneolaceae bacterium]|nr:cation diffusion facilitator family transporter [Balneolaceae bacterium]
MITTRDFEFPEKLQRTFKKTIWLEWITVGYLLSVVVVMFLSMGNSQAMKAAWLEDLLGLIPAVSFLVASRYFNKPATRKFLYGYHRVYSIAFLCGSVALFGMGLFLMIDSTIALVKAEHPTIGAITIFGHMIWMGWVMIAALIYSAVPAVILGRLKLPMSEKLHSKILHTDAQTQKADWMTAVAAIVGVIGIGFGLWWMDAAAAIFISLSVLKDGVNNLKDSVTGLMDETPTTINQQKEEPIVAKLHDSIIELNWVADVRIRLREAGNVFFGEAFIIPKEDVNIMDNIEKTRDRVLQIDWKLHDLVITVVKELPEEADEN